MPISNQNKYKSKRGRNNYRNNKKYFNKNVNNPQVEKCPYVVGTNEYHKWKRERYPTRTLVK